MKLLVFFNVLKCKIISTLCILLLPQLFTFANSLNTLFKRGLLKFYWTAKNTMAFFLKCTHLRYPFRMHEISIGLGLESLEGREFKVNRICVGKIQARLFDVFDSMTWLYKKTYVLLFDVERFPCFHLLYTMKSGRGTQEIRQALLSLCRLQ